MEVFVLVSLRPGARLVHTLQLPFHRQTDYQEPQHLDGESTEDLEASFIWTLAIAENAMKDTPHRKCDKRLRLTKLIPEGSFETKEEEEA